MCLYIKKLTGKSDRRNALKCIKALGVKKDHDGSRCYYSPYVGTPVHPDGVIVAKGKTKYMFNGRRSNKRAASVITGGAVHARYEAVDVPGVDVPGVDSNSYVAYAFGVKAYGSNALAASFIYVPVADKTPMKNKRRKRCEAWSKRDKEPTWVEINELFGDRKPYSGRIYY